MYEQIKCLRCGRILTSKESIEKGYGSTCYRIMQLQKNENCSNNQDQEIQFLKCEIAFLKRQFRELKSAKSAMTTLAVPLERIRQNHHRPEQEPFKIEFNVVINELKMIFRGDQFDYHEVLRPVNPRNQIESPILEEIKITN